MSPQPKQGNRPYRLLNHEKDMEAIQRIWIECGWIDGEDEERAAMDEIFKAGETFVATINDEPECATLWVPGSIQYQDQLLSFAGVMAVTTSHIARKQGFAKDLTAMALTSQAKLGVDVSALGIFDQGFYNKLGYGTGPYETLVQFDPATLNVNARFRVPTRLSTDDYEAMHFAMANRQKHHGAIVINDVQMTKGHVMVTENPFGLGYCDGPGGTLSHYMWGEKEDENGPYHIEFFVYQTTEQLMELLALIKSMGDQVSSFTMDSPGGFQFQDLLDQPFRTRRNSKGSKHEQILKAVAYWQIRILNLESCFEKTHLVGPDVKFNLELTDPLADILPAEEEWRGVGGRYVCQLGATSYARPGQDNSLPTLTCSVNALTRLWLGVRPASHLTITEDFAAPESLIQALDHTVRLPEPYLGVDI